MVLELKPVEGIKFDGDVLAGYTKLAEESGLDADKAQAIANYLPGIVKANMPVAPEKYEFNLPKDVKLDPAMRDEFTSIGKAHGIGQKGVDELVGMVLKNGARYKEESDNAYKGIVSGWKAESEKLLGEGEVKAKNTALIAKVREAFFTSEFIKFAGDYGFGDNPEMVKFMLKVGEKLTEHTAAGGAGGEGSQERIEDIMSPKTKGIK